MKLQLVSIKDEDSVTVEEEAKGGGEWVACRKCSDQSSEKSWTILTKPR